MLLEGIFVVGYDTDCFLYIPTGYLEKYIKAKMNSKTENE